MTSLQEIELDHDVDDDLYDEDGLLRDDNDADLQDKFNLINSVQKILKIKRKGKGAIRREAAKDVEEFVAVKRRSGSASTLNKLLESVKETGEEKAVDKVAKLVKAPTLKPVKTLEAPLEKPQALKSKRTVLYDNAKKDVSRWNAIVYHNRVAEQLVYPLNSGKKVAKKSSKDLISEFIPMTPLEEEMAKILYGEDYLKQKKAEMEKPKGPSDAEQYMLSVEEALNLHSEMSRLRALQSYQMAKAKRQNKIKSKKYHRLLRKEKIKKQLKEFEELQQKDPDAALEKLEELNQSRVQERMSLKHRNTSKWAKMQAARAKYNKDSRIALSEQLKISKDLTQKVEESSDEDDELDLEIPDLVKSSVDNPWMLKSEVKDNEKMQLYYSGYKKLWEQINAKKEKERKQKALLEKPEVDETEETVQKIQEESGETFQTMDAQVNPKKPKTKKRRKKNKKTIEIEDGNDEIEVPSKIKKTKKAAMLKDNLEDTEFTELDLDMMIEQAEDKIRSEASEQLRKLTKEEKLKKKEMEKQKKRQAKRLIQLKEKTRKMREGDVDEIRELEINTDEQILENGSNLPPESSTLSLTAIRQSQSKTQTPGKSTESAIINPNNYLKISKKKSKSKNTEVAFDGQVPNQVDFGDDSESEEEDSQRMLIAEAFEDDDIVDAFRKRKQDEIDSSKPQDIDLNLPGWGEWGGKGIVPNLKKRNRFVIKAPEPPPRKDARLSHVILNEEAGEKIKEHLVRELPFPFKRVKDYEKTIRAPVGRTWLPEQSMKGMIAPKIITRLGTLIEPLDEDVLVKDSQGKAKDLKVPMSIKRLAKVRKL